MKCNFTATKEGQFFRLFCSRCGKTWTSATETLDIDCPADLVKQEQPREQPRERHSNLPPLTEAEIERRKSICYGCHRWLIADSAGCDAMKECDRRDGRMVILWKMANAKCCQTRFGFENKWATATEQTAMESGELTRPMEIAPTEITPSMAATPSPSNRERLILHCHLSPGDILTMTAAVESLHASYPNRYLTDVRTPCPALWEHNPHITSIPDADGREIKLEYPLIHQSNQLPIHFLWGYAWNLGEHLGLKLGLKTNRPHVYLSPEEKQWTDQVRDTFAAELAGRNVPFWLVNSGVKRDFTAKQWPIEHFQEVIDRTRGRIQWVQIGAAEHEHSELSGVLNLVGKTDMRQLVRLCYHAQGALGPSTLLQHLMAAFEKPYLCLLGGREPATWVQYPRQHTFHTIGGSGLECCRNGACWKSRVVPLDDGDEKNNSLCDRPVLGLKRPAAKCMAAIQPEEVLHVLGRLI